MLYETSILRNFCYLHSRIFGKGVRCRMGVIGIVWPCRASIWVLGRSCGVVEVCKKFRCIPGSELEGGIPKSLCGVFLGQPTEDQPPWWKWEVPGSVGKIGINK